MTPRWRGIVALLLPTLTLTIAGPVHADGEGPAKTRAWVDTSHWETTYEDVVRHGLRKVWVDTSAWQTHKEFVSTKHWHDTSYWETRRRWVDTSYYRTAWQGVFDVTIKELWRWEETSTLRRQEKVRVTSGVNHRHIDYYPHRHTYGHTHYFDHTHTYNHRHQSGYNHWHGWSYRHWHRSGPWWCAWCGWWHEHQIGWHHWHDTSWDHQHGYNHRHSWNHVHSYNHTHSRTYDHWHDTSRWEMRDSWVLTRVAKEEWTSVSQALYSPWFESYWGAALAARPPVSGGSPPPHPQAQLVSTWVTWPRCPGGHYASCPSAYNSRQVRVEQGHWESYKVKVERGNWDEHRETVQRRRWVESGYWRDEPYTYLERVENQKWVSSGYWNDWMPPTQSILSFAPEAGSAATARWDGAYQARAEGSGQWQINRNVDLALDATLQDATPACTSRLTGYEYAGRTYGANEFIPVINQARAWDHPKRDALVYRAIVHTSCGGVRMQFLYDLEFGIILMYSARTG